MDGAAALAHHDIALAQQAMTYRALQAGAASTLQLITDGLANLPRVDARV